MLVRENKYIPKEDKDFFILLRIGLWQRVEEPLSESPDWSYIYTLACEQTVQGIVADGIGIYRKEHPDLNITQEENDKFLSASAQVVRRNFTINQMQSKISSLLDENSIKYYVAKGQEAAKNYPKPMLRCSGDIDYLLPIEQFQKARELLASIADSMEDENNYLVHVGFFFGDIEVELHGALHPNLGPQIDIVLDKLQADLFNGSLSPSPLGEKEPVLSLSTQGEATFNAVYVFLHCLQHFHWSGLGLRQILDWCMLLENKHDEINWQRVQEAIQQMNIQKEASVFYTFCVDWLGLEDLSIPFSTIQNHSLPLSLWQTCKRSGNMGKKITKESLHHYILLLILSFNISRKLSLITFLRKVCILIKHKL